MNIDKIDSYSEHQNVFNDLKMKPIYGTNKELNCGTISYGGNFYLLDYDDKDKIINFNKNFVFVNSENEVYPSYAYNYKRFTYLDLLFNFNEETSYYHFKNGNKFDLRRSNIEIYHHYHKNIIQNYNVIEYINGHYNCSGQDAYVMKNPLWKIRENNKEYLLLYCEKDTICRLCPESYLKILEFENKNNKTKITWFKHANGYIMGSNSLYIHQIIMNCYGNGQGTKTVSIDHIDQNPLNNTLENLRIATRKEQEQNSKGIKEGTKRERKYNAKNLPESITQDMMKKYVVYYHEWLDKEHTKEREFFKVEHHPKLDKPWMTSKSSKITIQEKLNQANKVVEDLENDIYPEKENQLPKYVSIINSRGKPHLVFEKRIDSTRLNVKMVLPEDYDLQEQINILNEKVKEKYENISLFEEKSPLNKFKYKLCIDLDDKIKNVDIVIFDVSRYGKYTQTIKFDEKVSVKYAVEKVEEWLSDKVTIDYFNKIKDDLFFKFDSVDEELEYIKNKNKGQLLTDCIFLEKAEIYMSHLILGCGS